MAVYANNTLLEVYNDIHLNEDFNYMTLNFPKLNIKAVDEL